MPKEVKVNCLNDYHPVALTSVAMKGFEKLERLVMAHINSIHLATLDPLQFTYASSILPCIPLLACF